MAMEPDFLPLINEAREVLRQTNWPPDVFAVLFDLLEANTVWQSVQNIFIPADRNPLLVTDEEATVRDSLRTPSDPLPRKWAVSKLFHKLARTAIDDMEQWSVSLPRQHLPAQGSPARSHTSRAQLTQKHATSRSIENHCCATSFRRHMTYCKRVKRSLGSPAVESYLPQLAARAAMELESFSNIYCAFRRELMTSCGTELIPRSRTTKRESP